MHRDFKQKILDILSRCKEMTVATVRPDGAPQATVVSFVHDGFFLYFTCSASSQKAANISCEPRVSVAMTAPYGRWSNIEGLSISAIAEQADDAKEISEIGRLIRARFPQASSFESAEWRDISFFRLRP